MSGTVHPLKDHQLDAVNPQETVWLSASAGTGKTQVLSARVLRLLLQPGVDPSQLLCLTFTKAGAAEMAVRVNQVLAHWVRMDDTALAADLLAIGADHGADTRDRARTLFASVLDCPGGGLRIDTIHAFSQWLLSAFPEEAGLVPGTRAMEDRERDLLFLEELGAMLVEAKQANDTSVLDTVADLSLRKGPDAVEAWLMRCAAAQDLWVGPGAWQEPMRERVLALLGLPSDTKEGDVSTLCADDVFDVAALRACMDIQSQWSAKSGQEMAASVGAWLAGGPEDRAEALDDLTRALFTQKGDPRSLKSLLKLDPSYEDLMADVQDSLGRVQEFRALLDLASWLTPALELGRKFALRWDTAKTREGLIDFDDQIRRASELLTNEGLSDWIRYKLDRQFDHILVDEAQDTNEAQWQIILDGLTSEFFAGEGQRDDRLRTLFVVGDYKQAIFRFQGTSPENFDRAKERVRKAMDSALANAVEGRMRNAPHGLQDYGLGRSFRTAQSVLAFVDAAIDAIGHESFGLVEAAEPHSGDDRPGLVTLWPPIAPKEGDAEEEEDSQSSNWFSRSDRRMADNIALQVRDWLKHGYPLVKGEKRNAGPGDVMVLVRKRKELAGLIVARLYAHGVPVAGVDRLRLGGPLAVQDLMAALRFAAQPLDDLNLANLLVSPLVGWSQEELLEHAWRDKHVRLWEHLRQSTAPKVIETLDRLRDLLRRADYDPPQVMLHWILVGPWKGRLRLVERLGRESNDPIDELLNAAMAYSASHVPSLQGFIRWFDVGEGELKRDPDSGGGQVRVMTVHGSKGLQSPIVILADAAGNPDDSPTRGLELVEQPIGGGVERKIPLPGLSKEEKAGPIAKAEAEAAAKDREEHWRLLYVAMTRAEEALFIGGALNQRDKGVPADDSWFARLAPLFPEDELADPIWGNRRELGSRPDDIPLKSGSDSRLSTRLPDWAISPVGPEPRPPRPLAPSSAGEDETPSPPFPPDGTGHAAQRGTLIHALLERLPELAPEARHDAALRWLLKQAPEIDEAAREEMAESALTVLETPEWAAIFGPQALAEVPLAATVSIQVVAGTADRLLVTPERVLVVDFKTTMRPPASLEEVPESTLRQMSAYVAALEAIYPGRAVEAAVLYTHTPQLMALPRDIVERHKQALATVQ